MSTLRILPLLCLALALALPATGTAQQPCPCVAPNVGGTSVLIPTTCTVGYLGFMNIINGLPVGTTIDMNAELKSFANVVEVPGGSLGGHIQTWDAVLELQVSGTGALNGFNRSLFVPVQGISHSAPRTPGDAVQGFNHDLISLYGELFGDPDFCTFRVTAGSNYGYPSPGASTLTRLGPPGNDFQYDSFFDVHYEIQFQGCPGSVLEGFAGSTLANHEFRICTAPVATEESTWGAIKLLYQ